MIDLYLFLTNLKNRIEENNLLWINPHRSYDSNSIILEWLQEKRGLVLYITNNHIEYVFATGINIDKDMTEEEFTFENFIEMYRKLYE